MKESSAVRQIASVSCSGSAAGCIGGSARIAVVAANRAAAAANCSTGSAHCAVVTENGAAIAATRLVGAAQCAAGIAQCLVAATIVSIVMARFLIATTNLKGDVYDQF